MILQKKIVQVLMQEMSIEMYDSYKITIDIQKDYDHFREVAKKVTTIRDY